MRNRFIKLLFRIRRRLSVELFNKNIYDGKLHIYITLRCNYNCPYCVDNYNKPDFDGYGYKLRRADEWINKINSLRRDIIFTGGEPFLYKVEGKDITDIINGIDSKIGIDVYSNIGIDVTDKLSKIKRPINLMISYHPYEAKLDIFFKNIDWIQSNNRNITFTIHAIDANDNMQHPLVPLFMEEAKKRNIPVNVDADQGFEGSTREFKLNAQCSRKIILLAPDGTRFQCVGKLTRRADHLENIFDSPLGPEKNIVSCYEYGFCAPCDWLGETKIDVTNHKSNIPDSRSYIHKTKPIEKIEFVKYPPMLPHNDK